MNEQENEQHDGTEGNGQGDAGGAPEAAAAGQANGDLDARIATLESEKKDVYDRMLRIAAEFENWKKRARKDQQDAEHKARESVLRDALEVMDNLERAVASFGDNASVDSVKQGVELVLRLFAGKLERHDVKPIDAKGKPFDPRLHEAIGRVVTGDVPPGAIAVERQKGYTIGDRLLRPAMVEVAVAPAPEGSA